MCGLSTHYIRNPRVRRLCRKLMALNLVPHTFICSLFNSNKAQARGTLTKSLFSYFEKNWLNSKVWSPKSWSVFMLTIRTNSPVESLHLTYTLTLTRLHSSGLGRKGIGPERPVPILEFILLKSYHNCI